MAAQLLRLGMGNEENALDFESDNCDAYVYCAAKRTHSQMISLLQKNHLIWRNGFVQNMEVLARDCFY